MATDGIKISEMPEDNVLSGDEYIPLIEGTTNKKMKANLFQKKLVSGTDIKTFNGESLLGKGNISIDASLNKDSNNAVRNSAVAVAVGNLNSNTGVSEYEAFSNAKAYSVGDIVKYNGLLYEFITEHEAGEWNSGEVTETSLKKEIDNNNNSLYRCTYIDGYSTGKTIGGLGLYKHVELIPHAGLKIINGIYNNGLPMILILNEDGTLVNSLNIGSSSAIEKGDFEITESILNYAINSVKGAKIIINLSKDGYVDDTNYINTNNVTYFKRTLTQTNKTALIKNNILVKGDSIVFKVNIEDSFTNCSFAIYGVTKLSSTPKILGFLYGNGNKIITIDDTYEYFSLALDDSNGGSVNSVNISIEKYDLKSEIERVNSELIKEEEKTDRIVNQESIAYNTYIQGYNTGSNIGGTSSYKHIIVKPHIGLKIINGIHNEGLPMIVILDSDKNRVGGYNAGNSAAITNENYEITYSDFYYKIVSLKGAYIIVNLASDGYIDDSEYYIDGNKPFISIGSQFPIVRNNRLEIFKYSLTDEIINQEKTDLVFYSDNEQGRFRSNAYFLDCDSDTTQFNINAYLYDNKQNIVANRQFSIIPIDKKTSPSTLKKILIVGDSHTNINTWCQEFKRRLTASDGNPIGDNLTNLEFIGTAGTTVPSEGYSGKDYEYFLSEESPFYINGGLNIEKYVSNNGYGSIDYLIILLGANRQSSDEVIKQLIDMFIEYNSNIKILLGSSAFKANPYGWSNGTINAGLYAVKWEAGWVQWNNNLCDVIAPQYQDNLMYVDIPSQMDLINNWQYEEVNANSRNTAVKVKQGIDNVHPDSSAYLQIADAFYNAFHYFCL